MGIRNFSDATFWRCLLAYINASSNLYPSISPQILAALAVSLGPFAAGLSKGYMSPAIASMQDTRSHEGGFTVSDQQASWIASLSLLGK